MMRDFSQASPITSSPRAGHEIRLLPGRHGAAAPRTPAVARRRRLLLACAVAVVLLAAASAGQTGSASPPEGSTTRGGAGAAGASADSHSAHEPVYIVQPGDNLWDIARRLEPDSDPRRMVHMFEQQLGGSEIVAGQRLRLGK